MYLYELRNFKKYCEEKSIDFTFDNLRTYNLEKIFAMQEVLDTLITNKEAKQIKHGWKAFYEEPKKYANTIVVDLVRLYIGRA